MSFVLCFFLVLSAYMGSFCSGPVGELDSDCELLFPVGVWGLQNSGLLPKPSESESLLLWYELDEPVGLGGELGKDRGLQPLVSTFRTVLEVLVAAVIAVALGSLPLQTLVGLETRTFIPSED